MIRCREVQYLQLYLQSLTLTKRSILEVVQTKQADRWQSQNIDV
jgi:hypothetical protein